MSQGLARLAVGDTVVTVDPHVGGRLVSWRIGDLEILGHVSDAPQEYGCYPMAPWPGRLRENSVDVDGAPRRLAASYGRWALHGTVLDREWEVTEQDRERLAMRVDLGPGWPWEGAALLSWHLSDSALTSTLSVESAGQAFPAEVGWHPWFRRRLDRGEELSWSLDATAMWERGGDQLPTGRLLDPATQQGPYDDAFLVPEGRASLRWPGALTIAMTSDVECVVVYDERPDFVCIEPQSAPPDRLSQRPQKVRPDAPRRATVTWAWSADPH